MSLRRHIAQVVIQVVSADVNYLQDLVSVIKLMKVFINQCRCFGAIKPLQRALANKYFEASDNVL